MPEIQRTITTHSVRAEDLQDTISTHSVGRQAARMIFIAAHPGSDVDPNDDAYLPITWEMTGAQIVESFEELLHSDSDETRIVMLFNDRMMGKVVHVRFDTIIEYMIPREGLVTDNGEILPFQGMVEPSE